MRLSGRGADPGYPPGTPDLRLPLAHSPEVPVRGEGAGVGTPSGSSRGNARTPRNSQHCVKALVPKENAR